MRMSKETKEKIVVKLNELYVMTRQKYLLQRPGGDYTTMIVGKGHTKPLNDGLLALHLEGKATYGVFAGNIFTKFLTFDVDGHDLLAARHATMRLVNALVEEFQIPYDCVNVVFSGSKGYHVTIFFDQPIKNEQAKRFFDLVTAELGDWNGKYEYRPNASQGVKLPLGVHQKTGKRAWFCDAITLEPKRSFNAIFDVKPMSAETFCDLLGEFSLDLTETQAREVERVVAQVDPNASYKDEDSAIKEAQAILEAGRLLRAGTRHHATLLLARFFYHHGVELDDAIEQIKAVIANTPDVMFSRDLTPEQRLAEVERLTKLAYDNGYALASKPKEIKISKSELLRVLDAPKFQHKVLLFSLLVLSKRFARLDGTFYAAYSVLERLQGKELNRGRVKRYLQELEAAGLLKIVESNTLDEATTKALRRAMKKANRYAVPFAVKNVENEPFITVGGEGEVDLVQAVAKVFTIDELRAMKKAKKLTRTEFEQFARALAA